MRKSAYQFGEEPSGVGCALFGDVGDRNPADFGQFSANFGQIGRFGEDFAVFIQQMGVLVLQKGRREVRGVGFEQKSVFWHIFSVFDGFFGIFSGQCAAEREKDIFLGKGCEGVGGPGVGVEQESGGVWRHVQQNFEHAGPGAAAMEAGGQDELMGKIELFAEDDFALGVEIVSHAGVEADFADTGGSVGELFAEVGEPVRTEALDEPGVDAEGTEDFGVDIGQCGDGGPVGFAGGVDMEMLNPCRLGASEDLGQVECKARILQMGVGVEPCEILRVRRDGGCYAHS